MRTKTSELFSLNFAGSVASLLGSVAFGSFVLSAGITQYDFPNGLRVLLYPDAAEPKVTFNVTYPASPMSRVSASIARGD
jgi:hypothetical protein